MALGTQLKLIRIPIRTALLGFKDHLQQRFTITVVSLLRFPVSFNVF